MFNIAYVKIKTHMPSLSEQITICTLLNLVPFMDHLILLIFYLLNHSITEIVHLCEHLGDVPSVVDHATF